MGYKKPRLLNLDDIVEVGANSFRKQVENGVRQDSSLARLRYLARTNYAYNYIWWLRSRSNDPAYLARARQIERRIHQPFTWNRTKTERAQQFDRDDYHFASKMIDPELVKGLSEDLHRPQVYHDAYSDHFRHEGAPEASNHPFLMMDPHLLFRNENFLRICATPDLIAFCREVLGPDAALSWAWSWISRPNDEPYQNQRWHRDCAEPLNMIRLFVPLGAIETAADGPTEFIPGTSGLREFFEVRRYDDSELTALKLRNGAGMFFADPGDAYFLNTFALHRGTPPQRQRAVMSLLVSLQPSYRTPSVEKIDPATLPADVRALVRANKRFFRYFF